MKLEDFIDDEKQRNDFKKDFDKAMLECGLDIQLVYYENPYIKGKWLRTFKGKDIDKRVKLSVYFDKV